MFIVKCLVLNFFSVSAQLNVIKVKPTFMAYYICSRKSFFHAFYDIFTYKEQEIIGALVLWGINNSLNSLLACTAPLTVAPFVSNGGYSMYRAKQLYFGKSGTLEASV